jgi:hypothetical protein
MSEGEEWTRESAGNYKQGKADIILFTAPYVDFVCNSNLADLAFKTGSKLGGKNAHL